MLCRSPQCWYFFFFRSFPAADSRTNGDTKDDDEDQESFTEGSKESSYFDKSEESAEQSKEQKPRMGRQHLSQHPSGPYPDDSSETDDEEGEMILTCKVVRKDKK